MLSEEKVAELRAQYGRVQYVTYNGVDLVFRKPSRVEVDMHAVKVDAGGAEKAQADNQLAQLIVVLCGTAEGPAAKEPFLALLNEYPYICRCVAVGTALSVLTGVIQDETLKNAGSASRSSGSPPTTTQAG